MVTPHPTSEQVITALPNYSHAEEIGRGGFKTVFRARHRGGVEVVKLIGLPQDSSQSPEVKAFRDECLSRAIREAKVLGGCESPFIVNLGSLLPQMLGIGGYDYVVYSEEYLDGHDLGRLIQDDCDRPSLIECVKLMRCLVLGIKELWSKGVVHRDIKPHNVIKLGTPDRPFVLLDLGIAFSLVDTALTFNPQQRLPPATLKYLAPEMVNSNFRANLDYRSDLYCAALTVFEYAAHRHPLSRSEDDLFQTITRAVQQPPAALARYRDDLPPAFCALVDQLLKKKPALRPANLDRLLMQLETFE